MRRRKPLKRGKPPRRVNPGRKARLHAEAFGDQAAHCRTLPCCICRAPPPSDPAHVRSRGAGGKDKDTVPMCRQHHQDQHQIGIKTFQRIYEVDLAAIARQIAAELGEGSNDET